MSFVADASVTLAWCFPDEATPWTESLLDRVAQGEQVIAPAHWPTEVSNGLLMALRRKRIDRLRADWFLDTLSSLSTAVEPPLSMAQAKSVFELAVQHTLTLYDATYLDLALRMALPLATLDGALRRAAVAEKVVLF